MFCGLDMFVVFTINVRVVSKCSIAYCICILVGNFYWKLSLFSLLQLRKLRVYECHCIFEILSNRLNLDWNEKKIWIKKKNKYTQIDRFSKYVWWYWYTMMVFLMLKPSHFCSFKRFECKHFTILLYTHVQSIYQNYNTNSNKIYEYINFVVDDGVIDAMPFSIMWIFRE